MAPITEIEKAETLMKLLDLLNEEDDVQMVFTNADMSDEVAAKLNPEE